MKRLATRQCRGIAKGRKRAWQGSSTARRGRVFQDFAMQSLMNLLRLSRDVFEALNSLMQALRLARSARSFSFICLRVAGSAVVRSVWDVTGLVLSPDCAWIGPEAAAS